MLEQEIDTPTDHQESKVRMKHSLLAVLSSLVVVGCVNSPILYDPPLPSPKAVLWGNYADHQVVFSCQQGETNPALVWVTCDFRNDASQIESLCLQVAYQKDQREVVHSRPVCANVAPNGSEENFAAFNKEKRMMLAQECGPALEQCTLSIKVIENK